jgi:hypothetical protein
MANTTPQPLPQTDVADLIATALAHPDLPRSVREGILDGICGLGADDSMYQNPEVLREIFKLNSPRSKKGGKS